MTDDKFCEIETAISGEKIDEVEQLIHCNFTGRELKEYLEQAFIIYYNLPSTEEIQSAIKEISKKSTAPDKQTPDWMQNDIENGINWVLDYLKQNKN